MHNVHCNAVQCKAMQPPPATAGVRPICIIATIPNSTFHLTLEYFALHLSGIILISTYVEPPKHLFAFLLNFTELLTTAVLALSNCKPLIVICKSQEWLNISICEPENPQPELLHSLHNLRAKRHFFACLIGRFIPS
jgi:hypothetical protein